MTKTPTRPSYYTHRDFILLHLQRLHPITLTETSSYYTYRDFILLHLQRLHPITLTETDQDSDQGGHHVPEPVGESSSSPNTFGPSSSPQRAQSLVNSFTEAMTETAASSDLKPEQSDESLSHDTADLKSDLGFFIDATKSAEDIERSVRSMSKGQKYHLLKHHDKPSCHYIFPTQYLGGCNRSFKLRWTEE